MSIQDELIFFFFFIVSAFFDYLVFIESHCQTYSETK